MKYSLVIAVISVSISWTYDRLDRGLHLEQKIQTMRGCCLCVRVDDSYLCLQVSSMWFKLFIYSITGCGPASLYLPKGSKLKKLPREFKVTRYHL